ncbi:M48 family metallopeptidase [Saccharophagus degradans]|uniref:M48 family metallopeptidase n=1 Tax=Saccharophagus degradans TaxID=86304 RepID=UPI001C09C401|nr:M48 family metallopeptidase [Saccharophagus degradans]MBU2985399.1 M48 family metallopeptidase [Saccharophagus degradans]
MNFFEHQDAAKKKTGLLVGLLLCAVASLIIITAITLASILFFTGNHATSIHAVEAYNTSYIEHLRIILSSHITLYLALGVCLVVAVASFFKFAQMTKGGAVVAASLGGRMLQPDSKDANERKVLNVVEEMAIASGNPVPMVFLLEESGINAFAAGNGRRDAVIGITRGAVETLTRDEIQGVIAHEFSHIHNGDMRLNMRLIAILHGILVIGLIGDMLWHSAFYRHGYRSSNDRKNGAPIIALSLALLVIGYAGTFFGKLIKAAVSRQREFLADASAVQFTRNPTGISGALKKIGGYSASSYVDHKASAQFSHMYFCNGLRETFFSFFATHPPLPDRIKRIEPRWDGQFIAPKPITSSAYSDEAPTSEQPVDKAAILGAAIGAATGGMAASQSSNNPLPDIEFTMASATALEEPNQQQLQCAQQFLATLPAIIHDACHEPFSARALMYCLLLDSDPTQRNKQLTHLKQHAAPETFKEVAKLRPILAKSPRHIHLALVDLAIPALKQQSAPQLKTFITNLAALIKMDGKVSLFEWCLYRIIGQNLNQQNPKETQTLKAQSEHAQFLLMLVASYGDNSEPAVAFNKGWAHLNLAKPVQFKQVSFSPKQAEITIRALAQLKPLEKPKLLKAITEVILADGKVTADEAELYRAIADLLNCPVPPLQALQA